MLYSIKCGHPFTASMIMDPAGAPSKEEREEEEEEEEEEEKRRQHCASEPAPSVKYIQAVARQVRADR